MVQSFKNITYVNEGNTVGLRRAIPKLFPKQSEEFRRETFNKHEIEYIIRRTAGFAFEMIEFEIKKYVLDISVEINEKSTTLKIEEWRRCFCMKVEVNDYNCVLMTARYMEENGFDRAKEGYKKKIAEKIIDYRRGESLTTTSVVNFFLEVFYKKSELYEVIKDQEKVSSGNANNQRKEKEADQLEEQELKTKRLKLKGVIETFEGEDAKDFWEIEIKKVDKSIADQKLKTKKSKSNRK